VLYLAEVQRKTRVLGASKAELRLIACQRSEQTWTACEETIAAPDDLTQSTGALVMVELTPNKQVKRCADAGRQLVSILQNFSRMQEKSKSQEEEIEQWKQSLTYQSQELNRREMEMEARQEQLQQLEEDLDRLEQQRSEIEASRDEALRLKEEYERKTQELEGAWAHLNGEMQKFDERKAEMVQSASLDEAQATQLQDAVQRLSGAVVPAEDIRAQITLSFEALDQQQSLIAAQWQVVEEHRNAAQALQTEVDQQQQTVQTARQEWHGAQEQVEDLKAQLARQQGAIALKQEYQQSLQAQARHYDQLQQTILQVVDASGTLTVGSKLDLSALEAMPLDELQRITQELERELEKNSRFVSDQEEELRLKQEDINQIQAQIAQASEYDRLRLESDLKDEQDGYAMLNETLVGQRRNLREREAVLKQHRQVLARRQGHPLNDGEDQEIDVQPILNQIEDLKLNLTMEMGAIAEQIQQMESELAQQQSALDQQVAAQAAKRTELEALESQLQGNRAAAAELWGKVNLAQEVLAALQAQAQAVRERVQTISDLLAKFQESGDYQLQAIAEMQHLISQLTHQSAHEFATP
jgi:chromosome segregation ATPase